MEIENYKDNQVENDDVFASASFNSSYNNSSEKIHGSDIMALTRKIHFLKFHLKTNKKDFSAANSLLKLVRQRKKSLTYLKSKSPQIHELVLQQINFFEI